MFVLNFIVLQIDIHFSTNNNAKQTSKIVSPILSFHTSIFYIIQICTLCQQVLAVTSERSSFEM